MSTDTDRNSRTAPASARKVTSSISEKMRKSVNIRTSFAVTSFQPSSASVRPSLSNQSSSSNLNMSSDSRQPRVSQTGSEIRGFTTRASHRLSNSGGPSDLRCFSRMSQVDSRQSGVSHHPVSRLDKAYLEVLAKAEAGNGEVRRDGEGAYVSIAQQLFEDDDKGGEFEEEASVRSSYLPQAIVPAAISSAVSKAKNWKSTRNQVKASVEEHQQRMAERQEVFSGLRAWVHNVMEENGGVLKMEYVDADQLDLEDEDVNKKDRPDPTGVGAALRLHWQETVREEADKRIKEMREQWEEDRKIEMAEFAQLRDQNKTLKKTVAEFKEQYGTLSNRMELLQRQMKAKTSTPPESKGSAETPPPQPEAPLSRASSAVPAQEAQVKSEVSALTPAESLAKPGENDIDFGMSSLDQIEQIGTLKGSLEVAEMRLEVAHQEADELNQKLREVQDLLRQAEMRAVEAEARVEAAEHSISKGSGSNQVISSSANKPRHGSGSGSGAPTQSGSSAVRNSASGSNDKSRNSGSGGAVVTGPSMPTGTATPSSVDIASTPEYIQLKRQLEDLRLENERLRLDFAANDTQASAKRGASGLGMPIPTPLSSGTTAASATSRKSVSVSGAAAAAASPAAAIMAVNSTDVNMSRALAEATAMATAAAAKAAEDQAQLLNERAARIQDQLTIQKLQAEVTGLQYEVKSRQPLTKQLQLEVELERDRRETLSQEYYELMDMQLSGLLADIKESGDNAEGLKRLVKEFDVKLRHATSALLSSKPHGVHGGDISTAEKSSGKLKRDGSVAAVSIAATSAGGGGRRRRLLDKEELQSLLAASAAKMNELAEIGGGAGAKGGVRGRPLSGREGGSTVASAEGSDVFEDDGMDEFSPRLAKIMRKSAVPKAEGRRQSTSGEVYGRSYDPSSASKDYANSKLGRGSLRIGTVGPNISSPIKMHGPRVSVLGEEQRVSRFSASGQTSGQASARSFVSSDNEDVPPIVPLLSVPGAATALPFNDELVSSAAANTEHSRLESSSPNIPVSRLLQEPGTKTIVPGQLHDVSTSHGFSRSRTSSMQQIAGEAFQPSGSLEATASLLYASPSEGHSLGVGVPQAVRSAGSSLKSVKTDSSQNAESMRALADESSGPSPQLTSYQPKFASPNERRPPPNLRVEVHDVPPQQHQMNKRQGGFVQRLAGSFHRLHSSYVSLEALPEVDTPTEAGISPAFQQQQQRGAHSISWHMSPVPEGLKLEEERSEVEGQQQRQHWPYHSPHASIPAQEALLPLLSIRQKLVEPRGSSVTAAAAAGSRAAVRPTQARSEMQQRPKSAAPSMGSKGVAGALVSQPTTSSSYLPTMMVSEGQQQHRTATGGPSQEMVAQLGPGASWQPLAAPQQQQQQRPRSAAAAPNRRSSSPPRPSPLGPGNNRPASPPRQGPYSPERNSHSSPSPNDYSASGQYLVRNITATPQKGFMLNGQGAPVAGRFGEGLRAVEGRGETLPGGSRMGAPVRWSVGKFLMLEEGQGMPQLPSGPVTFTNMSLSGYNMGLSAPLVSLGMELQYPGGSAGPSGAMMSHSDDTVGTRRHTSLELMNRVELLQQARQLQDIQEGLMQRLYFTVQELGKFEEVHEELVQEVQESRELWVAEHQYNGMLQEEMERMNTILTMVSGAGVSKPTQEEVEIVISKDEEQVVVEREQLRQLEHMDENEFLHEDVMLDGCVSKDSVEHLSVFDADASTA